MRDNLSHWTIQAVRDNPSHLTNLNPIDYPWRDERHSMELDGRVHI
jgi:hypothetical protein